jgi:hypothetical protein
MAQVEIGRVATSFKTQTRVSFPTLRVNAGETRLFFLRANPRSVVLTKAYFNVFARYQRPGQAIRTPLLAKFFPTGGKMIFLLPILQIREELQQRVVIEIQPKEFLRGQAEISDLEVVLYYEDTTIYPIVPVLPSA